MTFTGQGVARWTSRLLCQLRRYNFAGVVPRCRGTAAPPQQRPALFVGGDIISPAVIDVFFTNSKIDGVIQVMQCVLAAREKNHKCFFSVAPPRLIPDTSAPQVTCCIHCIKKSSTTWLAASLKVHKERVPRPSVGEHVARKIVMRRRDMRFKTEDADLGFEHRLHCQ